MMWPSRPDNWRCNAYFGQHDTLALAALISHFEPVRLAAQPSEVNKLRRQAPPSVAIVPMSYNDTWVRDTGPTTVVAPNAPPIAVDWKFNSWGGLFSDASEDDGVAAEIAAYENMKTIRAPIVLEGGAIISDGKGTLITTEEAVLADNRNPGLTRSEAEQIFRHYLNVENVVWLAAGLAHDESGGHVDNMCAFAAHGVVLIATTPDHAHPSFERCRIALETIRSAKSVGGTHYLIQEVPLPDATSITEWEAKGFDPPHGIIVRAAGSPLAPSHVNLCITNAAVFVPTFNCFSDGEAVTKIGAAFPDRCVVPYKSREFLLGGGAIHCLTKEIPS